MSTPEEIGKMFDAIELEGDANKIVISEFDTMKGQQTSPEEDEQLFIDIVVNTEPIKSG